MFINNNGVHIEVFNDGTMRFGGKLYHDDKQQHLKLIETKLSLFADKDGVVDYDKLPKRLRERLNKSLTTIYERLDENKDEGFIGINHLRAFGFLGEDRERIKRAAKDMNLIAYQMGLGSFEAAFERFKESERKASSIKLDAARFIDDFTRSNDSADNYNFFKSELARLGVADSVIAKEYSSIVFTKNKIASFAGMDKEKRVEAFIKDYKENEYSSFSYFNIAMQSFGVDNSDILKQYMEIGGNASKKIEDFYSEVYKNRVIPDREKIARFVANYKDNGLNDFTLFSETLQDFGINDTKEILLYFNDSIDQSFKLSSREFGLVSAAKAELIDLQEKIIKDAIEAGLEVPSNLSRLVSPSDKIKDEKINPEKIKMITSFDFSQNNIGYKSSTFDASGELSNGAKKILNENIALQLKTLQKDTDKSVSFVNLMLIKNNGFSFDRMKEWALYSGENNIINPQKAMSVAITGLKQCNKLIECGILQSEDGKNFTFSSPRAREILFENPVATYNELADITIKEHGITFSDGKEKPLNREIFETQKAEFEEFLDAQYKSYYVPQKLSLEDFRADALMEESQELQRYRDLYPELKKGMEFKEVVADFIDKDKYIYVRQSGLDFSSKDVRSKVDEAWKSVQEANQAVKDIKSDEKVLVQRDFINLSAVRFDGIDFTKLRSWGDSVVKNGVLSKEAADGFIGTSMKQGEDLVAAGVMVKNEKGYSFVDNFAKETLFLNYNMDAGVVGISNRGVKTSVALQQVINAPQGDTLAKLDKERRVKSAGMPASQASVYKESRGGSLFEPDFSLGTQVLAVVDKLNHFNYAWKLSGDEKYRNIMEKIESELKNELTLSYFGDEKFRGYLDSEVLNINDTSGIKKLFFDEFYEDVENTEKEDVENVFAGILNTAASEQEIVNG